MQQLKVPPKPHTPPLATDGGQARLTPGLGRAWSDAEQRAVMRSQVSRLESRLSAITVSSFPHTFETAVPAARGPRLLSLAELECVRDALVSRIAAGTRVLDARGREQERARVTLERMLLAPGQYRRTRIAQSDLGEGGCGVWHVKPRLGLVGMLMGWWQVKLSSGCPLAT